jgi:hypothetical protein
MRDISGSIENLSSSISTEEPKSVSFCKEATTAVKDEKENLKQTVT